MEPFPLFTSIPPNSNFGPIVENWRDVGFRVISINSTREAAQLFGVETIAVDTEELKLPISVMLDAIRETGEPFAGIINADCKFLTPVDFVTIRRCARKSIILADRIDVDQQGAPALFRSYGFDAVFFDTSAINQLKKSNAFKIGMPWWDYWLPTAFRYAGFQIKKFDFPVLTHEVHRVHWNDPYTFMMLAEDFRAEFPDHPAISRGNKMGTIIYKDLLDSPTISATEISPPIAKIISGVPQIVTRATDSWEWRDLWILLPVRFAWRQYKMMRIKQRRSNERT
jgi:hypothetical protein